MQVPFELTTASNGQFRFSLRTAEGDTLLNSETYVQKASAQNGIESVQSNSGNEARYDRLTASDGRAYFNLKAGNGQVIGTSPMFATEAARDAAVAATMTEGSSTRIDDKT
ncbi:MAG: YegP family protein [Dehalococcoidia bacterium]|nr:YegP family protein [Dehalococcoidia bacterium]